MVGQVVWGPNAFRRDVLWPCVTVDLDKTPDYVRKQAKETQGVCVCFYGSSIAQSRQRDYFCVPAELIVPWAEQKFQAVIKSVPDVHLEAFKAAHEEALGVEAGYLDPFQGAMPKVDPSAPCCFSCGKPMKPKEAAAAKEQHNRCNDCQALHQAGQHCSVCKRVWFDYEADCMATCKRCGVRVHAACDAKAATAVQAAAAAEASAIVKHEEQDGVTEQFQQQERKPQQLQLVPALHQQHQQQRRPYNCPGCRLKLAEESQMDLLHLHAVLLADMRPAKPRAPAEIFAAQFTRKHLASGGELDVEQLQSLISSAWLEEDAKGSYEQQAARDEAAFKAALPKYQALFKQYVSLAASQRRDVDLSLALEPQRLLGPGPSVLPPSRGMLGPGGATSSLAAAAPGPRDTPARSHKSHHHQQQQPALPLAPLPRQGLSSAAAAAAAGSGSAAGAARVRTSVVGAGEVVKAEDGSEVPQQIPIICNTIKGTFLLADMRVVCSCTACAVQPVERRTFTPTQYEQHAGCGSAKKWKASIRIEAGAVAECPKGSAPLPFGKWLEVKGIEAKGSKSSVRQEHHSAAPAVEWAPHILSGPAASVKRHSEMLLQQQQQQQTSEGPGGPSPSSSSKVNDGAAAGGDAGATSSGGAPPRPPGTTGIPRNRRPDSWAPWEDVNLGQYKPVEVRWAGDRCCVCDSDVDYDVDRLVSCDGCGITVHQSCYGIPELPDMDDMWLCRSCELKEPGAPEPQCCLCPLVGGGLKPTTTPGMWAHAACMQWIPEVTCLEPSRMEPIDRIQHIQKERWELLCCICRQRMGAKIQCNDCYQAYHPLCARRVGLHMEMADPAVPDGPLQLVTYCPKHCTTQPNTSGITLVSSEDQIRIGRPRKRQAGATSGSAGHGSAAAGSPGSDDDPNNNNGLWNAQPFRANRPQAPVPAAPCGCARAAPFVAKQIQHGTGTGCTSVEGFWIPTEETAAAPGAGMAAARGIEAGGPCSSSTSALFAAAAAAGAGAPAGASKPGFGGRKGKRGRGGSAAAGAAAGKAGGSSAAKKNTGPPPVVELLPLPEGVSDRVAVVCNGRQGLLLVRAQRVLVGEQELTASRFEAMCGKGDAKKWKSSLWAADAEGEPECCMGDWLSQRGLDKNALSKLAANWAAVEQRRIWEEQQQEQEAEQAEEAGRLESSMADGGATTEDGEEVTAADDAAESEAMLVDGDDSSPRQQLKGKTAADTAAAAGAVGTASATAMDVQQPDSDMPAAKKRRVSNAAGEEAAAAGTAAASSAGDAAAAVGGRLANTTSNASSAMASLPAAEQDAAAAAAVAGTEAGAYHQQQQQQLANGMTDAALAAGGDIDKPSSCTQAAAAAATAAAALRRRQGRVLLHKLPYTQLPDSFAVHPSSLPQQSAAAAAAARRKAAAAPAAAAGSSEGSEEDLLPEKDPWLVVGRCCRMYWQDDDEWYEADVAGYDPVSMKHSLWYHIDEVREEIDLAEEQQHGRVQWLPLVDKTKWPNPRRQEAAVQQDHHQQQQQQLSGLQPDGLWGPAGSYGGSGFTPWGAAGPEQLQLQLASNGAASGMEVDGDSEGSEGEGDGEAASAVEIPAPNFPRLTALHRDPRDANSVDLVGLSSSGVPLGEQLQRMVWQQQQQFSSFSRAQPLPGQAPSGHLAVGWRVGVFDPEVQMYYYGQLTAYDEASNTHAVEYDDGLHGRVSLQLDKLDWVAAEGQPATQAARLVHAAYLQQRAAMLERQQRKLRRRQQKAQQRIQHAMADAAGAQQQQSQQQRQTMLLLQAQMQQVQAALQQSGWQPGMPVPAMYQQRLQQLAALRQQLASQTAAAAAGPGHLQAPLQPQQQQRQQMMQQQQPYPQQQQQQHQAASQAPAGVASKLSGPKPGAPTHVDVMCGTNRGVFDCLKMAVLTESGSHVSPTEFERVSGKGSSKKWKCTIRVRKANGTPGITMGDWLLQMGYDQPKEPRGGGEGAGRASLNDIRKQQAIRKAAAAAAAAAATTAAACRVVGRGGGGAVAGGQAAGGPGVRPGEDGGHTIVTGRGVALHREGCMCVICKQARRKAAQEAGLTPAPEDAYIPRGDVVAPAKALGSSRAAAYTGKGPPARSSSLGKDGFAVQQAAAAAPDDKRRVKLPSMLLGKRAYVQAVPHLVRGAAVHKPWQIPQSKCYSPQEWEALQQGGSSSARAGSEQAAVSGDAALVSAAGGSRAGTPSLGSRPTTPQPSEGAAAAAAGSGAAAGEAGDGATSSAGGSSKQQQQGQQGDRPEKRGSRTQTWREKLRVCRSLEPKRITFGKSGIHGWGIFARQRIEQDSMVTEFRGQLVRCILADVREVQYRKQARDCYMFHASDDTVIDNTGCGNYSRFTNHCCAPCLYAKPLELGGELHLCFFARTDIKPGQELTFDYRFKEEDSDSKVICQCAAPTCKGTLN